MITCGALKKVSDFLADAGFNQFVDNGKVVITVRNTNRLPLRRLEPAVEGRRFDTL